MTTAHDKVKAAQERIEKAQAELDSALEEVAIENSFPEEDTLYAVVAATADFGQFVSYSKDAELIAVFDNAARADKFANSAKNPEGRFLIVRPVTMRS